MTEKLQQIVLLPSGFVSGSYLILWLLMLDPWQRRKVLPAGAKLCPVQATTRRALRGPFCGPAARAPSGDMIRPWYRSRLFWLGLPGLAMLLWLWLENPMRHFEVKAMWGNRAWYVADSSRLLEIGWDRRSSPYIPSKVEIYRWQRSEDRLFPPALWLSAYGDKLEWDRRWFVAYWLLIAGYIPLWLCGVAWWQRRKKRLLKTSIIPSS